MKSNVESIINFARLKLTSWALIGSLAALLSFIGFHLIYTAGISEYVKEFIAGCLGALITIAATAALLKSQTDGEISKEQVSGIFKEKLQIYNHFISHLNEVNCDAVLTQKELNSVIDWATRLSLVSNDFVVRSIYEHIFQIVAFNAFSFEDLNPTQVRQWKTWQKSIYDNDQNYYETEDCEGDFVSFGHVLAALRNDLLNRKSATLDDDVNVANEVNLIRELQHVVAVRFSGEDIHLEYEEAQPKPKKPRVRPVASSRKPG